MRKRSILKRIDDIATVKGGKRVPKGYKLLSTPTNHPYLTVTDFTDAGSIDTSNLKYIDDDVYEQIKNYTISSKDIYISIAGTIGKSGVIPAELNGANLTENACKLILSKEINQKYFYYFTLSNSFIEQTGLNTRTTTQPKLALERLKTITLPVPDLREQKRIVAILDEAFAGINQAIANTEKNLAHARELFESYLNSAFESNSWQLSNLENISNIINGYSFKSTDFSSKAGLKSIKITNVGVREYIEDESNYLPNEFSEAFKKFSIPAGSIVVALTRSIISSGLKVSIVPLAAHNALLNQRVAAIIPNNKKINTDFVYYYLCSKTVFDYVKSKANTLMQPNLSLGDLKSLPVPYPQLDEQKVIVTRLHELNESKILLLNIYQQKLQSLAELKQSLLQTAFSGELTANNLDKLVNP